MLRLMTKQARLGPFAEANWESGSEMVNAPVAKLSGFKHKSCSDTTVHSRCSDLCPRPGAHGFVKLFLPLIELR